MSQRSPTIASRRLFLRNSGTAVLSGAAVALLADHDALAQSETMPQANLHDSAPTQFQEVGDVRLAYRRFGKEGATPVVCLQHFRGRMDNWDPIHTNRLAQDRPVVLVDYRGVGRSSGETPDSMQGMGRDIIAFIRALGAKQVDIFGFSIGGMVAQQIALDAPELVRRLILAGTGPSGGEGMAAFSPQVQEILSRPNSTPAERGLALFFSPTATSQAAGKAWLARITARQVDREPDASPQVGAAQLAALTEVGASDRRALRLSEEHPAPDPGGERSRRHHGPYREFVHPSAEASRRPAHALPGFRAWRAFSVSRGVCRSGRPLPRR